MLPTAPAPAVQTDEITDPTWNDVFDRDRVIKALEGQVRELRETVEVRERAIERLLAVLS